MDKLLIELEDLAKSLQASIDGPSYGDSSDLHYGKQMAYESALDDLKNIISKYKKV